jgi:Ser/Thr protein kinase RdoA (MazF antagonist)
LLAAGCDDRRPVTLAGELRELLARALVRERLGEATIERLDAFVASVPSRAAAVMSCGVPATLMHGDFHAGNVAVDGESMLIFDWTDGCLSHPFFDLATFLPDDPVERAALIHAYLEAWTPLFDMATLERAWELAEPLALAHHAISYMRIMDAVYSGATWELSSDEFFWLRWLRAIVA